MLGGAGGRERDSGGCSRWMDAAHTSSQSTGPPLDTHLTPALGGRARTATDALRKSASTREARMVARGLGVSDGG